MSVYGYVVEPGNGLTLLPNRSATLIKRLDGDTDRWEPVSDGQLSQISALVRELNKTAEKDS